MLVYFLSIQRHLKEVFLDIWKNKKKHKMGSQSKSYLTEALHRFPHLVITLSLVYWEYKVSSNRLWVNEVMQSQSYKI